ncbi:hypothetical protein O181_063399 [Austropuccinia psidii MF-1]|uniref:tRNA 4-demethylwyosine synthase (AdoMet-dependent) n=1 Tax=Austropuccinia psidii MF-1 TaxID=1389203 RepID=A0A9Q3EMD7_9BASI|nr:hypothetical protein [Austropuccinia psidii MF-1]
MDEEDLPIPGGFTVRQSPQIAFKTHVLYCSLSSTTKKLATQFLCALKSTSSHLNPTLDCLDTLDLDQLILLTPQDSNHHLAIFFLPSYNVESPVDSTLSQFRDALYDFRLPKNSLSGLNFAVFGVGDRAYGKEFCKQAIELDQILEALGGRRLIELTKSDVSADPERDLTYYSLKIHKTFSPSIQSFSELSVIKGLSSLQLNNKPKEEANGHNSEEEAEEEQEVSDADEGSDDQFLDYSASKPLSKAEVAKRKSNGSKRSGIRNGIGEQASVDIEDLGSGVPQMTTGENHNEKKEMISSLTRKSLTKQGYAIIGSHSAVKTCRWTKASLRGRGFCYKHAFYGIQSHQCMEATPSLACANKCTFCWRAHTNPVGTSWRWKTDDADFVVSESLKEHDRLIKQLSGMPGVRPERFLEARTPRHAALSLVGEPVMFPHIKRYIQLLTEKRISTFLVTNAQFPEALIDLPPVTQLYLSIDAGSKDSLKSIDRPLHRDFWERFLKSIDIVKKKRIRTVFRLTLVKGENSEEIEEYAELIRRGEPDFIEVKGVTYCGYPGSSNLTIQNSPWHHEVAGFVERLCDEVNKPKGLTKKLSAVRYGLAAEHAHSCCVLAANTKYYVDDQWHTWINYDRFFELVESGERDFDGLKYCSQTPDFAIYGSPEAGFSPEDQRWFRKSKEERKAAS